VRDAFADWLRLLARLPEMVATTARGLRGLFATRRAATIAAPVAYNTPDTPFNKALRVRRVFASASLPLDECRRVKDALGVTLNDVVLALCAGSLRRWLAAHDGPPNRPLIASIPVSADAAGDAPRLYGNRVAYFQTALRVDLVDPVERLLATRDVTAEAKRELEIVGRRTALDWMEYLPAIPYTLVKRVHSHFRLADLYPSPSNLVVSNVAGPREPLYWSGARLVELYSVGPLSEGIGLNLTVWSYCDRVYCALLACHEQISDPHAILWGMHDELRTLLDAAQRRTEAAGTPLAS
jgi:diacylglycerol O-acyltransferase